MKNKLNLSVGVLTYNAPKTLQKTLDSIFCNDINLFFNEILVYINPSEYTEETKKIVQNFNLKYFIPKVNTHIGPGFKWLTENSQSDNILLLEDDFHIIEQNKNITYEIFKTAIDLITEGVADVARLRSRRFPGDPLHSLWFAEQEHKCLTHLAECVHWKENPDLIFPKYCQKIFSNPVWYLFSSKYANFTNNPCIYKKNFYYNTIASMFCELGSNIEDTATPWWTNQDFKIIIGDGLFTHERLDGK